MTNFKVSVIIPFFNSEKFLAVAIESVLGTEYVSEILLIDDGSSDNSRSIAEEFAKKYSLIKVFQHPNGQNKGVSASRNLGMKEASCEFIAFLDSDDLFAKDRFKKTFEVFKANPSADGVYEAIGYFINGKGISKYKIFSVHKSIKPSWLFHYLIRGTYGHFSTDGITFKRNLLDKTGGFNTNLVLHEDSELWLKMAHFGILLPGELEKPVAFARRHDNNTISGTNKQSNLKFWKSVKKFYCNERISLLNKLLIDLKIARYESDTKFNMYKSFIKNIAK